MSHVHTNRNNHPDIIDRDGDRWSWTDSDVRGNTGYRLIKRANPGYNASPDLVSVFDINYLRETWGPIKEIPVTASPTTFKLPEIPADVEKIRVVGSDKTFERSDTGTYWVERNDTWGDCSYTLAEILGDYPEGVEAVVKTELEKAVEFFQNNTSASLSSTIKHGYLADVHAAVIVQHYLDNHAE